jgi:hypothetical protein
VQRSGGIMPFAASSGGGGGTPGGVTGQSQYNNAGAFGGVDSFILPNRTTSPGPVASLPQTGWTIINGGLLNDFASNLTSYQCQDNSTSNWRIISRSITVPYTIIALIEGIPANFNGPAAASGFYISDGTKLEGIEQIWVTGSAPRLRVQNLTNVTTASSTPFGPTALVGNVFAIKIVNNSTNRIWSYWSNGAWVSALSEASGTFLTETTAGPGCLSQLSAAAGFTITKLMYLSIQ